MTVDCRYASSQVQPVAGFLPILEVNFQPVASKFQRQIESSKDIPLLQRDPCCGRKISVEGIKFDPEMIQSLLSLPETENAANLQKFLCGANWIRSSIPENSMEVAPLQELMGEIMRSTGSAKSSKLKSVQLKEIWKEEHSKCFERMKHIISHSVTVAYPKDGYEVCLFTDASDCHWGVIVTQMPKEDLDLHVLVQRHEPVAFLSGTFNRSQKHCSVIEKEAFPIVEAVERLRHLLLRDEGFRLFTDHRYLIYVLDPILRDNDFKKQAVDKLCRWASKLFAFKYVIDHIDEESNIWADILSRWKGDGEQKILRPTLKVLQWNGMSPLPNE
jgi:hypothetical protein